jgi:hypothetical protein
MAGLRTLLNFPTTASGVLNYDITYVWNTNTTTMSNGGQCCLWTVPASVTWAMFEVWGGGGGGGGVCCCFGGWPGGSGSYARKIISNLSGGQTFTVCAGGTTDCAVFNAQGGYPSYVIQTSTSTTCACASGGSPGGQKCYFMINCSYSGCPQQLCGSYIGSFGICGVTGSAKGSAYCSGSSYQFMPSAPFTSGMSRPTKDGCSGFCGGCCNGGYALFPGGGGASTFSHTTGPFCGAAGAGGLVKIYYARVV